MVLITLLINTTKYKFGFHVPQDYSEAMLFDKQNGNTKWQDAILTKIQQVDSYSTFKDMGNAVWDGGKVTNAPQDHKKIRAHLVFDVNYDGRHKARLVADGHLTDDLSKMCIQEWSPSGASG